jgi:hypothetical protein
MSKAQFWCFSRNLHRNRAREQKLRLSYIFWFDEGLTLVKRCAKCEVSVACRGGCTYLGRRLNERVAGCAAAFISAADPVRAHTLQPLDTLSHTHTHHQLQRFHPPPLLLLPPHIKSINFWYASAQLQLYQLFSSSVNLFLLLLSLREERH